MSLLRASIASLAVAAALAMPGAALANGRYPAAGQIVFDPSNPNRMIVRATYGILQSLDGGKSFFWICEGAVGYGGFEDPMMGVTADGTALAGIFEGLSVSRDQGCQWDFAGGGLEKRYAIDLTIDKMSPADVVVLISNSTGPQTFLTQVWHSADNATSFTQSGVDMPADFLGLTLDPAPSDPSRIYVSGRLGAPDYPGVLEVTSDGGQTWMQVAIPGADDTHLPYVGAVDPLDRDKMYVRLDADPSDSVVVTENGGMSFASIFQSQDQLLGFALSPDGTKLAVGGPVDGLWIAPTDTYTFTKVNDLGVKCLTWTADGLYACADEFVDGFTAGVSKDEGASFTAIMHLQNLCPLTCPSGTSVTSECPAQWGAVALTLNAVCEETGAGGAGGSGGAGGGGTGGGGVGGCDCGVSGDGEGGLGITGLAAIAAIWINRRLRGRGSRARRAGSS